MSKQFNEAFRRALRGDPEPQPEPNPETPARPVRPVDGGAGTGGSRTREEPASMNDLIRRSSRERG